MSEWVEIADSAIVKYDVDKHLFWVRFMPHSVISGRSVWDIIDFILFHSSGTKFGIIGDFREVLYIEEEAHRAFLTNPDTLIAVAVIMDEKKRGVLKDIFLKEYTLEYEHEFFYNESEAYSWLLQKISAIYDND